MDAISVSYAVEPDLSLATTYYRHPHSKAGLLLLPGMTEHRASLDGLARHLSAGSNVWTVDLNGQGQSGGYWSFADMRLSITALSSRLRTQYRLERMGAFGNSLGAYIAAMAVAAPERLATEMYGQPFDALVLSGAPAGMQDYFCTTPPSMLGFALKALSHLSHSSVRRITILQDRLLARCNERYRQRSHPFFIDAGGEYRDFAMLGATRLSYAPNDLHRWRVAQRLDAAAGKLNLPVQLWYGSQDRLNGVRDGELPFRLRRLVQTILAADKRSECNIVPGADHSLNERTRADDDFNTDEKFLHVRERIAGFFERHLSR